MDNRQIIAIVQTIADQECWALVTAYNSPIVEYKLYSRRGQLAFRNMNTGEMNPVELNQVI